MRRGAVIALALGLLVLAGGAWVGAQVITGAAEEEAERRMLRLLGAAGHDWASLRVDGLNLTLSGEAPDGEARVAAFALAARVAGSMRIIDATTVRPAPPPPAPAPRLILVRHGASVTLSGFLPGPESPARIREALAAIGPDLQLTDATEPTAAGETGDWLAPLALGLRAAATLSRARIDIGPCRIEAEGLAPDETARAAILDALRAAGPCLATATILAQPPLVSPYAFALALGPGGARLGACAAPSPEARLRIEAALGAAGLAGQDLCPVALGAPSEGWTEAVLAGIATLSRIGAGELRITDSDMRLSAPKGLPLEAVRAAAEDLAAVLPAGFSFEAVLAPAPAPEAAAPPPPPLPPARFSARRGADGQVELAGLVPGEPERRAVATFAAAGFGSDRVTDLTAVEPSLPDGWTRLVLAGLEALAILDEGALEIGPAEVRLAGRSRDAAAPAEAERILAAVAGDMALAIEVTHVPVATAPALPDPALCLAEAQAVLAERQIQFATGSSRITQASLPVLDRLAGILKGCGPARFEIGGHTDDRGPEAKNLAISEQRANAVVDALLARGVALERMVARGYGEEMPIADNATEEGRTRNRRISLRLVEEGG